MERSIEERLFAITDGIRVLIAVTHDIIKDLGNAPTPYWDIIRSLSDAGSACCEAIKVEVEKKEASHA